MVLQETFRMANGAEIPKIALGTWQTPDEKAAGAVKTAISLGYRHIDTAIAYRNEHGVGVGIEESGIDREDLFITSKIPAEVKSYEGAEEAIDSSLKRLNTDYIDLMLIHAPKPWSEMSEDTEKNYYEENLAVWKALEEAYEAGKLRSIGVSNFGIADLENIFENAKIKPMVNQIRIHIGHVPHGVIDFCRKNGVLVEAYSPNATGRLPGNKKAAAIAEKYGVSVAQLGIRFDLQLGTLPLPKSVHSEYIEQNAKIDFEISDEDMNELLNIGEIDNY